MFGFIFDLDGTLIDSSYAHYLSHRDVLSKIGLDISYDDFKPFFGFLARDIQLGLASKKGVLLSIEQAQDLADEKNQLFQDVHVNSSSLLPGVERFLERSKEGGIRLSIASNSNRSTIDRALELLDLIDFFDVIVSVDDVKNPKPDPEMFQNAASKLGVDGQKAAIFEDSSVGLEAAIKSGFFTVGLLTGSSVRVDIEAIGPNLILDDLVGSDPLDIIRLIQQKTQ